jgi:PAS domain S-box-containing protein
MKAIIERRSGESFLRDLFDLLPAYVAYVGPDLRYVAVNDAYVQRFGKSREEIIGSQVQDVVGPAADTVVPHLRAALAGQIRHLEPVMGSVLGQRTLSVTHLPHRDADGNVVGVVVYGYDITDTRRAEKALMQSEKLAAVGKMASTIAHELNNPLEALSNLLFLAEHSGTLEEAQSYLRLADMELRRASAITTQTLKFNRQLTQPTQMTAEELFESLLESFAARFRNSEIKVEKRYGPNVPILSFEGEIRQVFINLIANAIDAMPTGGTLCLRGRVAEDWRTGRKGLSFMIADSGPGINQLIMDTIFQPFHTTKGAGGTGLGLWICKQIVDRHFGRIQMKTSRRAGQKGTVFSVFLPFEAAAR